MIHDRRTSGIWFAAGAGLGALAGLLFAPKSGRDTREAIASGVYRGHKYLLEFKQDAGKRLHDAAIAGKTLFARKKKQLTAAAVAVIDSTRRDGKSKTASASDSSLPRTGTH